MGYFRWHRERCARPVTRSWKRIAGMCLFIVAVSFIIVFALQEVVVNDLLKLPIMIAFALSTSWFTKPFTRMNDAELAEHEAFNAQMVALEREHLRWLNGGKR
jgi:hypothetical protein